MTFWRPEKKTRYALCASETEALLAEVSVGRKGARSVRSLSSASRGQGDEMAVNRLFASTGRKKAMVALVLPLSSFEIVSVTVPAVNREAVARLLPYNLSKILDAPVTDYIYDWQVVQTFAERQELTVFLYPVAIFNRLQQDLHGRQKEIAWFEADVFSACSYLELNGLTQGDGAILCVLVWQGSISMAVYEQGRITLVRSVDLRLPVESYLEEEISSGATAVVEQDAGQELVGRDETVSGLEEGQNILAVEEFDPVETEKSGRFGDEEDLLAEFCLLQDKRDEPVESDVSDLASLVVDEGPTGQRRQLEWHGYLQNINLEIMRTNDYTVSVLKGKPFNRVFVGGAESFFSALERVIKGAMEVQVEQFPPSKVDADCDQNLAALCIGALRR
jgi:hypothetical protein